MSDQAQSDMNAFTAGMAGFPGFDAEGLGELIEDTSLEAALKVLARFRVTVETGVAEIETALKSGNAEPIWKTAHKLAGTAELVGFAGFGRESKDFSHVLKEDPDLQKQGGALVTYLDHCRRLVDRLRSFDWLSRYL
jgi:HPt (histidine-containing phosphotransfer) domain-containing protein